MIRRLLIAPLLKRFAANRPARAIDSGGREYMYRIFLAEHRGTRYYLHWFVGVDGERHTHNHPFPGYSIILSGGYREEVLDVYKHELLRAIGQDAQLAYSMHTHRLFNRVPTTKYHRVADALAGTWTLFIAGPDVHTREADRGFSFARVSSETDRLQITWAKSSSARWWESAPTLRELLESRS